MIGVAILGAGIGAQHLDGYRALPAAWDVRLIVDRDTDRARALCGDIPVAAEIETALSDPAVEVIDICLPPHLHVPVACQALAAGKHVICEKPIATSLAEIDTLRAAKDAAGKHYFPIFQYRYGPAFTALNALKDAGLVGRPLIAAAETHWARNADYYAIDWRGTWAGEQGGAILGHAIHAHDLLCCHAGPVAHVTAALATRANDIETEDCGAISFELETGALATSSITLGAATDETRLRFVFKHLTATSATTPYAPGTGTWQFAARDPAQQPAVDTILAQVAPGHSGFAGAFTEIHKQLNNQDNHAVSFEDGARAIELVTAIYDAARNGRRVSLPLTKEHPMYTGWHP